MNIGQRRVIKVLENMIAQVEADNEFSDTYASQIDDFLSNLNDYDFFGTEGQLDPRGDFRLNNWSVRNNVQGVG